MTFAWLLTALPAWAFDALRTPGGRVVHAPRTPWPVFVQADAIDKLSVTKVQAVTLAAIDAWNSVADTRVQLSFGGLVREAPHMGVYVWLDRGFTFGNNDGIADTTLEWDDNGGLQVASIALNGVDVQWITGTSKAPGDARPSADLQAALTHQLGHALGLSHTHDSTATMYFWGTSRAGRTLTSDDARALRFVYPATEVTASTTCDPCRSDADCAGAGRCLAWPDGFAYCAAPCKSHEDCPIGTGCGAYSSGIACLPLDGHCSADRATDNVGDPCASDFACTRSWCMPVASGQGFCTTTCAGATDPSCGDNGVCNPNGDYCVQFGDRLVGEVCRVPGDCQSADCRASTLRTGTCGQGCNGQCKSGEMCGEDGLCRLNCSSDAGCPDGETCHSGVCRGPLAVGWPCSSGYDCAVGACVALPGMRFDAVCTISCNTPADCPAGTGCSQTSKGSVCVPGAGLTSGSPCATNLSCGKGFGCDFSAPKAGFGTCTPTCDPFGTGSDCPTGRCAWAGDAKNAAGLCRSGGGSGGPGHACTTDSDCSLDLTCAQGLGSGPDSPGPALCSRSCDPAAPLCDAGLSCIPLAGTSARGVCMDGGALAQELPTIAVKQPVNLGAFVVNLPQVVPVAEFTPPAINGNASNSGCSAAPIAPSRAPLLLLLLAFALLRRLRLR